MALPRRLTLFIYNYADAMKHLPTSDDDKYHGSYPSKVSAALDLAQLTRGSSQPGDSRESLSEWQFSRTPDGTTRSERRTVTNPNLTVSAPSDDIALKLLGGTGSASGTPLTSHGPSSRRGSPHSLLSATRSVPATPLGLSPNILKTPGTPNASEVQAFNGRTRTPTPNSQLVSDNTMSAIELQGTLSRLPHGSYDNGNIPYNSVQSANRDDVWFDLMSPI